MRDTDTGCNRQTNRGGEHGLHLSPPQSGCGGDPISDRVIAPSLVRRRGLPT
jgi:hypothetical protein